MTLRGVILREKKQVSKVAYYIVPFILHLRKGKIIVSEKRAVVVELRMGRFSG